MVSGSTHGKGDLPGDGVMDLENHRLLPHATVDHPSFCLLYHQIAVAQAREVTDRFCSAYMRISVCSR